MRRLAKLISDIVANMGALPEKVQLHHRMTTLVAIAIATRLPLPSGQVESYKEWYIQNCIATVEQYLVGLVEYLTVDVDAVMDIVERQWQSRYMIVHEPSSPVALRAFVCALEETDKVPPVYADALKSGTNSFDITMALSELQQALDLTSTEK